MQKQVCVASVNLFSSVNVSDCIFFFSVNGGTDEKSIHNIRKTLLHTTYYCGQTPSRVGDVKGSLR